MHEYKRGGRARKAVSRKELKKSYLATSDTLAQVGALQRCQRKSKIEKGPTREEREIQNTNNVAIQAGIDKKAQALQLEQKAKTSALHKALRNM